MSINLTAQHKRILYRATMSLLKQTGWLISLEQEINCSVARLSLENFGCLHAYVQSWAPQSDEKKIVAKLAELPTPSILIADFINSAMGERLRKQGRFYLDAVGNAFLKSDASYLHIQGNKQAKKNRLVSDQKSGRAYTPTGMQLIFYLLEEPSRISLSYRRLASLAGIAIGSVGSILTDLKHAGFLIETSRQSGDKREGRNKEKRNTQRELINLQQLAANWSEHYAEVLRNRKQLGRFVVKDWSKINGSEVQKFGCWGTLNAHQESSMVGASKESAGKVFDKPNNATKRARATLYLRRDAINSLSLKELSEELNIVTSPDGDLDIIEAFWSDDHADAVHPLIAYSDMLSQGVNKEAQIMKRLWSEVAVSLKER